MTVSFRNLQPLLNPRSIAIIGASERHGSAGCLVIENLHHLGYSGEIYAINPKNESVLGHPCYKDLDAIGKPVDMVAILIGSQHVKGILETMNRLKIPACWVLASGFSESGEEGAQLQRQITQYCREHDLLLCGPNCIGVANMTDQYAAFSVAINPHMKTGNVSAVMQSGAILMGLANSARLGFRYLISAGNQAALDTADYIGYLATDPQTKVIIAFVEGIPDAPKFLVAVRAAYDAHKPVLMLKVGRSEAAQRAVQAHTGSLAGSDAVLDTVFRREGVVRLNSLDELVEAAELFSALDLPENNGVGLISLSGGQIGLAGDLSQGLGIHFASLGDDTVQALKNILPSYSTVSNPLDAWGNGDVEKMVPGCVSAIADEPNISLIAIARDTPLNVAEREVEQSLRIAEAAANAKAKSGKGVCLFSNFSGSFEPVVEKYLREQSIPYLQGTQEALRAIQAFEDYAAFRKNRAGSVQQKETPREVVERWKKRLRQSVQPVSELEGRQLLAEYGIAGPKEAVAADADAAVKLANSIGYPVVMKILSPDIQHKTESGGVKVGVDSAESVRIAYDQILASVHAYQPDAKIEGILVQEMISQDAVEMILGVLHDATFGPVVVFGSGGVLVELIRDSALGMPPLFHADALRMIESTQGARLLKGFRGKAPADISALAEALVNVSRLAMDFSGEIAAMDINPLMVLPEGKGVRAVDVLIELSKR